MYSKSTTSQTKNYIFGYNYVLKLIITSAFLKPGMPGFRSRHALTRERNNRIA